MDLVARSEPMPPNGGGIQGSTPLAGHMGLPALLVRETVQNAWDARDDARGDNPALFAIEGWDVDTDSLDHLRALLPVHDLEGFTRTSESNDVRGVLHPSAVLKRDAVRVLVIADRNTVGLCGPTRSGHQWDPIRYGEPLPRGQQRFANFVRNVGRASANIGEGDGGTYGVGKSALWMASECGTILVHTRTTDERGNSVERFIGSVHGEHFYSSGREYTGRHFIGRLAADDVIEPLDGADAAAAARNLPIPPYEASGRSVYGTTIVIIAPRLYLDWPTEMNRLRDAIRWHVWPKRVPGVRSVSSGSDLDVRVGWNGHNVDVPAPLDDPELRPYARVLLDCARDRKDDENRDFEARCRRPMKLLGATKFRMAGAQDQNVFHLTLSQAEIEAARPSRDAAETIDVEPAVDFSAPWGQIALIRREPLLLVRYESIAGPDAAATEVGVFLSADDADVEGALTKAEPPAHDDWIHRIVPVDHPRDHRRTFAKRTIEEIKSARLRFLATFRSLSGDPGVVGGEQFVSREISVGLLGGLGGRRAPNPASNGGGTVAKPRTHLELVRSDQDGDGTVHELDVTFTGLGNETVAVVLEATGSGYDNAGAMPVDGHVSYAWTREDGSVAPGRSLAISASDTTHLSLIVKASTGLRLRPKVTVERVNAS